MSKISVVPIKRIESNPFRELDQYPYVERKLEALKRSIEDVGLWEGVIARERGDKYQLAFGHHRVEAARQLEEKEISVIVRALTDEQMLQFMGRENMEDYNADFLIMLETWEAGIKFRDQSRNDTKPMNIARLLGWTRHSGHGDTFQINDTASACNAAHALISAGYLNRKDLSGMSVKAAQTIAERAQANIERLEKIGRETKRSHQDIENAKKQVAKGAKAAVRDAHSGQFGSKELRGRVDFHSYKYAQSDKKISPMFSAFGEAVAKQIEGMLRSDSAAEKLEQIQQSINLLTIEEDLAIVRRIDFALSEVPRRAQVWQKKLVPTNKKVIQLLEVNRGK